MEDLATWILGYPVSDTCGAVSVLTLSAVVGITWLVAYGVFYGMYLPRSDDSSDDNVDNARG